MADNKTIATVALGILSTISMALAGWALSNVSDLNEKSVKFELLIEQIQEDQALDIEQNRRLDELKETDRKFWQIHSSTKDYVNGNLRSLEDPLFVWPVFNTN